jgi:hypothetical protein
MNALSNLLDPAVLFFVFGVVAGLLRSNLEIPAAISRFLSLYLLMSVGLKGGFSLSQSGLGPHVVTGLLAAALLAVVIPLMGYVLLKRWLNKLDAAAVAATYGSVSATTFIAATQYLANQGIEYGGHMAAALVLMESPAIIMAVALASWVRRQQRNAAPVPTATQPAPEGAPLGVKAVLHEALTDGAQLLLLGSLVVGMVTGEHGKAMMEPFSSGLFKGMLAIFLLDMGLLVARQLPLLKGVPAGLLAYGLLGPLVHGALAIGLAWSLGLSQGDATLLTVLAASASYIVVPAVLRHAIPEANPGLYLGLSLAVTFVFNILAGIPLYTAVVARLWG